MIRLLWTEIDLDVIAQNMQIIRKMAKSKEVAAVIKADAYGCLLYTSPSPRDTR